MNKYVAPTCHFIRFPSGDALSAESSKVLRKGKSAMEQRIYDEVGCIGKLYSGNTAIQSRVLQQSPTVTATSRKYVATTFCTGRISSRSLTLFD